MMPHARSRLAMTSTVSAVAFVLSAGLSGLAGATKAIAFQFASLTDVHWATSGDVILMVLLGGVGTTFGLVVGAIVIVSLDEFLADSGLPIQPIIGTIFVLCILLFRSGIVGTIEQWLTPPPPKEPAPS